MIVDTHDNRVIQVNLFFERPVNQDIENKLNYILDTLSELEYDYDDELQKAKRLG